MNRVYQGSVSMLLNNFVEKQKLSARDIKELREFLDQAKEQNER